MMRVIGIGDGSYVSKRDGQRKEGYRLYLAGVRDGVVGECCEDVWLRKDVGADLLRCVSSADALLGLEVAVYYDRYQHVQQVVPCAVPAAQSAK